MAINNKPKISQIAKNFNLKNKDITDILAKYETTAKLHTTILENEDLNIIFEYLTQQNQVDNINFYLTRTKKADSPQVTNSEPDKQQQDVSKIQETKTKEFKEKKAKEEERKVQQQPKKEDAPQHQQTMEAPKLSDGKPHQTQQPKIYQHNNNNNQSHTNNRQRQQTNRPQYQPRQFNHNNQSNTAQSNNQSGHSPNTSNQSGQSNQHKQQRYNNNNNQSRSQYTHHQQYSGSVPASNPNFNSAQNVPSQSQNKQNSNTAATTHTNNIGENKNQRNQNREMQKQYNQSKREFAAPTFNTTSSKNKNKPQNQRQSNNFANQNRPVAKGTVDIISATNIKLEAGVKSDAARIVDTRTTSIDLSKYDEKLDKFASEQRTKEASHEKQKIKKGSQSKITYDRFGKPVDKEKLALEKMQKLALEKEKAKKKQLQITLPEQIMVSDLASKLHITSAEVVKKLFLMGTKASVNEVIDYDTAAIAAMELGAKVDKEVVITIEDRLFAETEDTDEQLVPRSPVVVVMGHVDHGKTSLLDAIKNSNVAENEAGGITQHIGAYRVKVGNEEITFLDTPGHEAFTAMRARGAQVTDIAILVVAADDGVMPQTIEAINHAKAAKVGIIVAVNKMDRPSANLERVKQDLANHDLVSEDWGGDIVCVPVSAVNKQGIDELLEMITLTADMMALKANPNRLAKGTVIEAKLDKGRGPVATVLVQNGTLNVGDIVIAGTTVGRVRAMSDYKGKPLESAAPSYPVEIIGLSETPNAGDDFRAVEDEKMARELVEQRKSMQKEELFKESSNITLEDLFAQVSSGVKELNLIIKADVHGSVEAVKSSLEKESTDEVKIRVIHKGVGGINESDVMLAAASNAIIIGFNVRPDKAAIDSSERQGVDIRTYRVIYECIEEINAAMKGMLAPKFKEMILGHAQVRQTIRVPSVGTIAGSYVQDGKISRNSQIRVIRDGIVIFEDKIASLKRFKDDAREVAQGFECGIGLLRFNDIKEADILESYVMEEIPQ